MAGRGMDPGIRRDVEHGKYEVDTHAVAEAIIRSWVLIAAQLRDGAARPEKDQAAAR